MFFTYFPMYALHCEFHTTCACHSTICQQNDITGSQIHGTQIRLQGIGCKNCYIKDYNVLGRSEMRLSFILLYISIQRKALNIRLLYCTPAVKWVAKYVQHKIQNSSQCSEKENVNEITCFLTLRLFIFQVIF